VAESDIDASLLITAALLYKPKREWRLQVLVQKKFLRLKLKP